MVEEEEEAVAAVAVTAVTVGGLFRHGSIQALGLMSFGSMCEIVAESSAR